MTTKQFHLTQLKMEDLCEGNLVCKSSIIIKGKPIDHLHHLHHYTIRLVWCGVVHTILIANLLHDMVTTVGEKKEKEEEK